MNVRLSIHHDNQQPGPSRLAESNIISINGDKKQIFEQLKEYVRVFVRKFEEKLEEYKIEAGVEGKPKTGKIGEKLGVALGAVPGAAIGLASGIPGAVGGGAAIGGKISSSILNFSSAKGHRKKAKKVFEAFRNIEKGELRKMIAKAGCDIFQSFEYQFTTVTDTDGRWARAMEKLAIDARNRAINYINEENELGDISSDFITKGVILGKSKKGLVSTIVPSIIQNAPKMPKPGHTVTNEKEAWNTSELFDKVGLVTINGDRFPKKYYGKKDSSNIKYGYRLFFAWEFHLEEKLNQEYYEEENCFGKDYQYILKSQEIEENLKDILDKINKDDPMLKLERIEEGIEKGNEGINQLQLTQETGKKILKLNQQTLEKVVTNHDGVKQVVEKTGNDVTEIKQDLQALLSKQLIKDKGPVWFNMKEPVKSFTGRDAKLGKNELGCLHDALQSKSGQVVVSQAVSISGLGGIGKSELARKYAYDHGKDYASNAIWINSEAQEDIMESFRGLAGELRIPITEKINEDMKEQKRDAKSIIKDVYKYFNDIDVDSLFIFDNAESDRDIKEFLPSSLSPDIKKPHVLITSRNQDWEIGEEGKIIVISLEELTPEAALEFVKNVLDIKAENEIEAIKKLAIELQNFPLALRQAVSYIKQHSDKAKKWGGKDYGISDYLIEYKHQVEKLLNEGYYKDSDRYTKTVLTTWNTTLEKIKSDQGNGKQAVDILNIIAYFAPDEVNIKEIFAKPGVDEKKLRNAVELLDQYSMINLEKGVSSIHRLVQQVIRLRLKNDDEEEGVLRKALELINNSGTLKKIISHVISVWNCASNHCKLIDDFYFSSNSISVYGYNDATPLHLLTENGNDEAVKNVLEHIKQKHFSQVINSNDKYNRTSLYMAAENGYVDVVKLLVANGAKINTKSSIAYAKNASGFTPLHISAFNGHQNVVEFLVNENRELADIKDSIDRTSAVLASHAGHVNIVKFLKPNDNVYLLQAKLCCATESGNLDDLKDFIQTLKNKHQLKNILNSRLGEWLPLHLAAFSGLSSIVELLIINGAEIKDPNKNSFTPLHAASSNGHLNTVKLLVKNGADPKDVNKDGWTSLHAAAQNGHLEIVKYFLSDNKIKVNISDKKGTTTLHTAAFHGKLNVVEFLLGEEIEEKADINVIDIFGATPLFSAALNYNFEIVNFLLHKGTAVVNHANTETLIDRLNISVLHVAAVYDAEDIVGLLVKKGVDKDVGKDVSLTPLHIAAFFNSSKVIKYLINQGADVNSYIRFSNIIQVLNDVKKDRNLIESSMYGVVNKLFSIACYFADSLKLTPSCIDKIFNNIDNELLNTNLQSNHLNKIKEKLLKWIFNLDYVKKHRDNLKIYVNQRKNSDFSHPIDAIFYKGKCSNINAKDDSGNTILHLAVIDNNIESVKYLINEKKVDANISNDDGKTPLTLVQEKLSEDPENNNLKEIKTLLSSLFPTPTTDSMYERSEVSVGKGPSPNRTNRNRSKIYATLICLVISLFFLSLYKITYSIT